MKILVLAPMDIEKELFLAALQQFSDLKHQYQVVECGIGKVNAASISAVELYKEKFDMVALVGFSAASEKFPQGTILFPQQAEYADINAPQGLLNYHKVYPLVGKDPVRCLTSDSFVTKRTEEQTDCIFDMEGAAVAHVCDPLQIPLLMAKMVSDNVSTEHGTNFDVFTAFINSAPSFAPFVQYMENMNERTIK